MRRRAGAGALLLAAAGLGCRGDGAEQPAIAHLAALYAPPDALLAAAGGGRAYAAAFELPAEVWEEPAEPDPDPGLWRARAPWYASALPALPAEPARLVLGGDMALRQVAAQQAGDVAEPGAFAILREEDGDYLVARLSPGTRPAAGRVEASISAGGPGDGGWRLAGGPFGGDGFLLRPDAPARFALDVPAGARLLFDALVVRDGGAREVALRVRLGGELVAERKLAAGEAFLAQPQSIELPAAGIARAELALEVEGGAWCGLLEPRLAPAAPETAPRPDVVLFLADTFRADNLSFYGGAEGVTPVLDAFGATCLRFRRVWSPACWTLPAHASFLLGVYPPQHGAVGPDLTPGAGLVSIAQRLRDAGYRTAAVTDSLFVSRRFELDRGFERFEEYTEKGGGKNLERTLARARVLAGEDDGRPLFLFVHTYRVHEPYEASAATRAELGARLGLDATWEELKAHVFAEGEARVRAGDTKPVELAAAGDLEGLLAHLGMSGPDSASGEAFVRSLRALYLGGVRDLDRAFAGFLADLDARPRAANTWLIFTSDHGEGFNEHGTLFHGHGSFDETLRVPLFLRGPSLRPRDVEQAASLVDLPQTIAHIAGVAPDPRWLGTSLVALDVERPVFAFDCAQRGPQTGVLIRDGLKVVFTPEEEAVRRRAVVRAFDLAADPGERADVGAEPPARAALDALAERVLELMRALAPPGAAVLSATDLRHLKDMGYTGEDR